jgi:hypothetical protein
MTCACSGRTAGCIAIGCIAGRTAEQEVDHIVEKDHDLCLIWTHRRMHRHIGRIAGRTAEPEAEHVVE